jgi:formiminoglutamase
MSKLTIEQQLLNRKLNKVGSILKNLENLEEPLSSLIIKCSDDSGVQRNGGKLGSRFAPQAIISELSKFELHDNRDNISITEVSSPGNYKKDFSSAQKIQSSKIKQIISKIPPRVVQIGGGHDHIYPLLKAIDGSKEDLLILNIDAHLDTRTDALPHSGTPFRQFSIEAKSTFNLVQLGVRKETNHKTNYIKLNKGMMRFHAFNNEKDYSSILDLISSLISQNTKVVLSLDCDGIDGSDFGAVSATNPHGTPFYLINNLVNKLKHRIDYFGLYELNPLFDNITNLCAKRAAWLVYQYLL